MRLASAEVGPFKSIDSSGVVTIDEHVTVLVGMNEAGKTAFLQALHKSASIEPGAKFEPTEDYPRKDLTAYMKKHPTAPATVTRLVYSLNDSEAKQINATLGTTLKAGFTFSVHHRYNNTSNVTIDVDEKSVVASMVKAGALSTDAAAAVKSAATIRDVAAKLESVARTPEDDAFKAAVDARIAAVPGTWKQVVGHEVWTRIKPMMPRFLYFDDYYTLPGKINLQDLQNRIAQESGNPAVLEAKHRAVLALLRMADISVTDLSNPDKYEVIKAKLEGISNTITDQVFKFWKQNESLEVEFDIRQDSTDVPPFNSGSNLYIRIKNKRHRVTVPFDQRSKGFIWFFSFLAWFDSVQQQLIGDAKTADLVLLLDEPGLSLHALAQADFLRYMDVLSKKHQVLYTTHSPFMIHPDRLMQVRVVEDRDNTGTVISGDLGGSDSKTLFPLQAALGYSLAQNLFISRRNLLIEGPSDLIYLRFLSSLLETERGVGLRGEITLVPTGGLDKVATFVALIGARELELGVLHDSVGTADQRLASLVKLKMIDEKSVLTYADFRTVAAAKKGKGAGSSSPSRLPLTDPHPATDIEDLLPVPVYLALFNTAFAARLGTDSVSESDLAAGDRILDRLTKWLAAEGIVLRKGGGFNHFTVASAFASKPPVIDDATLDRFQVLIETVNGLFSPLQKGEGG
jgi:hypothetical protein